MHFLTDGRLAEEAPVSDTHHHRLRTSPITSKQNEEGPFGSDL